MKNSKIKFVIIALFAIGIAFTSCQNNIDNNIKTEQSSKQGQEYTSAYVCPMHCEGSGSDAPGECPVCGMDYVKNKDHAKDGHQHEGHEH